MNPEAHVARLPGGSTGVEELGLWFGMATDYLV